MTALEPSEGLTPPDRGLQSERTSLSWVRTSLSILGLSAACLRWLPPFGSVALIGPSVAAVLVVVVTVYERRARPRRLAQFSVEKATPALGMGAALALGLLLLSATGLWILLK